VGKRGKEAGARARALVYVNVRDVIFFLGVEGDAFRFLEINPAFTAATGLTEDAVVGKLVSEVIPEPSLSLVLEKYRTAIREQRTVRWEEATDYPTGKKYGEVSITPILEPDGTCSTLVGTVHDVTADVHARVLGSAEQKVLEMVASGDSLSDTLTELVLAIEKLAPPAIASILLVSADGRIWNGAAPHLPKGFSDAIEGAHIGPYEGSCGAAAALRRPVIVTDIETDPLWDNYRGLAREHGLRACWSTPILSRDRRVLGTFALYYREPRSPREHDLDLVSRVVHVAGIAIGRHELDEQLRALSARIESAREEERTGIAREIHDQLGQSLTVLKMDLAWIVRRAQSQDGIGNAALVGKVTELAEMTDEIIGQVRRISAELRPGVLDDLGLSAALSWQMSEFQKRTGIVVDLSLQVDDTKLRRDLATAIFRIVQEALTNVARHARAEHVAIELEEREGELHLEIADDGCGLPPAAATDPRSLGLLGMRERARRLGGTATFSERQPRGTALHFVLDPGAPPSG
jgi:PAS domain S-box-containing protein